MTIVNDDAAALTAAGPAPAGAAPAATLTIAQLRLVVARARVAWLRLEPGADLSGVQFTIAELGGLRLGETFGRSVTIDATAAGWGWSVADPRGTGPRMDLLVAVMHELGHVLGFAHADAGPARMAFMAERLSPTVRGGVVGVVPGPRLDTSVTLSAEMPVLPETGDPVLGISRQPLEREPAALSDAVGASVPAGVAGVAPGSPLSVHALGAGADIPSHPLDGIDPGALFRDALALSLLLVLLRGLHLHLAMRVSTAPFRRGWKA